jgi:hypothetical protein
VVDVAPEGRPVVLLLSRLLGSTVRTPDDSPVGRLRDLVVRWHTDHPMVSGLVMGRGRASRRLLPWSAVSDIDVDGTLRLRSGPTASTPQAPGTDLRLAADELLLARDLMDTQVVDLQEFRLSRISDLYLAYQPDGTLEVAAAEVGFAAVLRRLGLGSLGRSLTPVVVDWTDLHLTSRRAHEIQLRSSSAAFHGLDSRGLAELLTRLSTEHATELIQVLPPGHAAAAIHHSHPTTGRRLLRALRPDHASLLIEAAHPSHAARLAELRAPQTPSRRLLRTAGWRRNRPAHEASGRPDRGLTSHDH